MRYMKLAISTGLWLYSEVQFHPKFLFLTLIVHHHKFFLIGVLNAIKHWTPDQVPVLLPYQLIKYIFFYDPFLLCIPVPGEAYMDWRLTINFELWVEIFCVPTCFHMRIPNQCLSVCPHPEKRNHHSFVNMSLTLVHNWFINGKVFTCTTPWKPQNLI